MPSPGPPEEQLDRQDLEVAAVYQHRYKAARKCGLSIVEAALFADSDGNLAQLRNLIRNGCPIELARRIVL